MRDNISSIMIVMLQIIATVVVFNLFWGDFEKFMTRNHMYEDLNLDKVACITVSDSDDSIFLQIKQEDGIFLLGKSYNAFDYFSYVNDESVSIQPITEQYAEHFACIIAKGSWYSLDIPPDTVSVVVPKSMSNKYKLGEIYELYNYTESKRLNVCVTGVMSGDSVFIPPNNRDDNVLISDMSSRMLVCCSDDIIHLLFGDDADTPVYTIAAQDQKSLDAFVKNVDLEKYHYMSVSSAKQDDDFILLYDMGIPLSITLIMFILCIANFSSYSVLSSIKREKEFAIYYLCGSTWRECLTMQLLEDLTIVSCPFALSVIICSILSLNRQDTIMTAQGMFLSLLLCLVIMFVSSFVALMRIKKSLPIEIIRRWL